MVFQGFLGEKVIKDQLATKIKFLLHRDNDTVQIMNKNFGCASLSIKELKKFFEESEYED